MSRAWPWPAALFLAAFGARVLFWRATADAGWPHSAYFKGDAWLWLEYASSLRQGQPFELGIPLHPPGTAYLIAELWTGKAAGVAGLKGAWCALGALAVVLAALAIERAFGRFVGRAAGVLMAASTSLLVLSTSLDSETPYLALVAASFLLLPDLIGAPRAGRLSAWAALNGLACLFRVEHVLFTFLVLVLLAAGWGWRAAPARLVVAAIGFGVPLVPWHVSAWSAIERFNAVTPEPPPALRRQADLLAGLAWEPEARAREAALPAFARDTAATFVAASVAHRGGTRVRGEDFDVLGEAFGSVPRPLSPRPFVSLYGPLNFALANHPRAGPGFGREALETPPPLAGGKGAYPAELIAGLPPRDLALAYPPHLLLVNQGYALGWGFIASDPGHAIRRAGAKLGRFWAGAASGLTGFGVPLGLAGTRHAVDMVVQQEGPAARAWRLALLAGSVLGAVVARRNPAVWPWLLFLLTKAVAAAAFFGYARLGAVSFPVVALLLAVAAERALSRAPRAAERAPAIALMALLLLVAAEAVRFGAAPALRLDGRPAGPRDPFPPDDHLVRRLEL